MRNAHSEADTTRIRTLLLSCVEQRKVSSNLFTDFQSHRILKNFGVKQRKVCDVSSSPLIPTSKVGESRHSTSISYLLSGAQPDTKSRPMPSTTTFFTSWSVPLHEVNANTSHRDVSTMRDIAGLSSWYALNEKN